MIKSAVRCIVFIFCAVLILSSAIAVDVSSGQADALEINKVENAVPESARDILGDTDVMDMSNAGNAVSRIINGAATQFREILHEAVRGAIIVIVAAVFSSVFNSALPSSGNYATLAGVLAISAVSLGSMHSFVGTGTQVLEELSIFSKTLLPCLTAAAAASGAITSAAAKYAVTVLFLDIFASLMKFLVLPLIYAFCAVTVAEAAVGGEVLGGVSSLIKWLVKSVLSVFVILFILYTAVSGIIASSADAVAVRAAKVTISTVLPVVGSILADAADTVLSGAAFLRNAVGVFGVLAVTAVCAIPFLRLGVNYLLFKAAGGLSGAIADSRITKLINGFSSALGMTLGVVGINAVTLFVSIVAVIKTVV